MSNPITAWSDFIITDNGLALRQKAIALGLQVRFVYAEVGEGVPSDPSLIPIMTSLVMFKERAGVSRTVSDGATHHVDIVVDNREFAAGFPMREIGLYAEIVPPLDPEHHAYLDPDLPAFFVPNLYGYSYTTSGYESVPKGEDQHRLWTIGAETLISRGEPIVIVYDASSVYVNANQFDMIAGIAQETYDLLRMFDENFLILGMVDPTPSTEGKIKQFYLNVMTGAFFACILISGNQYIWIPAGGRTSDGSAADINYNGNSLEYFLDGLMFALAGMRTELDLLAATVNAEADFSAWLGSAYLGAMYLGAE